jgi:branched-chain amino acid transport system permease protein
MTASLQILLGGLALGGVIGLLGEGFGILYKTTGVLSIAQGAFMLLGALFYLSIQTPAGWILALLGSFLAVGALGAASYLLLFRRLTGMPPFVVSIATVALSGVLVTAAQLAWGSNVFILHSPLVNYRLRVAHHVSVSGIDLLVVALALLIGIGAEIATRGTRFGLRARSVAEDPFAAVYLGVKVERIASYAWAAAAACAALGGSLYALGSQLDPGTLPNLALIAFPAVLLGGLDSVGGALVGGFAIGFLEQVVTYFGSISEAVPAAYLVMLALMFLMPTGLFGRLELRRL